MNRLRENLAKLIFVLVVIPAFKVMGRLSLPALGETFTDLVDEFQKKLKEKT